ncbi:uncharacterized protein ASPGLDRAFT_31818, partial [Aspergillus glaucus CBS 516.65]
MKFAGIAAMAAVVTAVTGAAIPNVNAALAEVHQVTGDVQGLLSGAGSEADVAKLVSQLEKVESELKKLTTQKRDLIDADVAAKADVAKLANVDADVGAHVLKRGL